VLTFSDRFDAIAKARRWISSLGLPSNHVSHSLPTKISVSPLYPMEDLLSIVNPDIRMPMDMWEIVLRLVDGSKIEEFKTNFGKGMITAWAHLHGTMIRARIPAYANRAIRTLGGDNCKPYTNHQCRRVRQIHSVHSPLQSEVSTQSSNLLGWCQDMNSRLTPVTPLSYSYTTSQDLWLELEPRRLV
jgi:hypothetical protein